ncbi:MAG: siderophore ABC transporter substrate-binding protein [Acidimicrobiales bacterium]
MRPARLLPALVASSVLALASCGSSGEETEAADSTVTTGAAASNETTGDPETTDEAGTTTIEVEDNFGVQTVSVPPRSVVATDNRTFETLSDWGIELSAAAVALMPDTIAYTQDDTIIDLGNHNEPDLEAVVAAQPDLIINGQRFAQYREDFVDLVPEATIVELDPREGEPFDQELIRQVTVLGEIFGKEEEAAALVTGLQGAIARSQAAYDPANTVMAVNVSGGEIGYIAPTVGRALGPVFDLVGMTPALEVDGASDDHQGDDISVEAIAAANPDIILVIDRDAAVAADDPAYEPAAAVIEESEALSGVTAVAEGNIVYMPADTYTNEGIQTYTEFLNSLADTLEGMPG